MSMMIKMSEATSIALHALAYVASNGSTVNATELARVCRASEAHTMKVCQRLNKAGILEAKRGPGGGFSLARDPAEVTLKDIYTIFDGPMSDGYCMFSMPACGEEDMRACIFGHGIRHINRQIINYFEHTRLADIAANCHRALLTDKSRSEPEFSLHKTHS